METLCGPNLKKKNLADLLLPLNMLLIPVYLESLEKILLLCHKQSWGSGFHHLAAAWVNLLVVPGDIAVCLGVLWQWHSKKQCLERGVKDSGGVLWSTIVLGGFLPAASLSGGRRRGICCLNTEQPPWEPCLQVLRAVRGGDEVKEQVCS